MKALGWSQASGSVPEVTGRGGSLLLTYGLLVPTPSIAFGSRGSQLSPKRDFLGLSALLFLHSDFQALLPVPSETEQNHEQQRATEPL